jgi:hypothetical protein
VTIYTKLHHVSTSCACVIWRKEINQKQKTKTGDWMDLYVPERVRAPTDRSPAQSLFSSSAPAPRRPSLARCHASAGRAVLHRRSVKQSSSSKSEKQGRPRC